MHYDKNYSHVALAGIALIEEFRRPIQSNYLWKETFNYLNKKYPGEKVWGHASELPFRKGQNPETALELRLKMLKNEGLSKVKGCLVT
ncbi:MAG: hypothetical protein WCI04_06500 [archaeon]